jgi:hypothetical protein
MTLDRLLEGLEVAVEPFQPRNGPARGPRDHGVTDVLELACGATVHCSAERVSIVPTPRRAHAVPTVCRGVRIRVTYQGAVNLFTQLPEPLVEPLAPDDPLRLCFAELLDEIAAVRPGHCVMAQVLLRRFLILMLRRCFERGEAQFQWLAVLADARLGRAVAAMHDHPGHVFTVTKLADLAAMSRTAFAARFSKTLPNRPSGS